MQSENFINMSNEELYEYRRNLLKENTTLSDFLSCKETAAILYNEHLWNYKKNSMPRIEKFYNKTLSDLRSKSATPLYYDIRNEFSNDLGFIIYKNIKKEYDLDIFYDCPDLANLLIDTTNQPLSTNIKKKTIIIKPGSNSDANKKFDWESKTYK